VELNGLSALVTGAASGLGAAAALKLSQAGCNVACLDRDGAAAEALARSCNATAEALSRSCSATAVCVDVTDTTAMSRAVDRICETQGVPRLLVTCAGVLGSGSVIGRNGTISLERFVSVINVNLIGTFDSIRLLVPRMTQLEPLRTEERGLIITTSSVAAWEGLTGQAAYSASKGGVAAMTVPLARELGRFGIRVVSIAPGLFATKLSRDIPEGTVSELIAGTPFPWRLGMPSEFARLVESVAGNVMLNGTVIRLDGGIRMDDPRTARIDEQSSELKQLNEVTGKLTLEIETDE
jgi:NAD(P)-dependent dehydrogenase (short-subunit alcohol dehydrogenase family)